ncbi:MAG TPA: serine hydrolase [Chloroflexia bacterium]|nr:serine hydrolase [Chloroflexia bacterium]
MAIEPATEVSDTSHRISRIESGLVLETAPWREEYRPTTILDRMEHYGIPGVSVAVINNGEIEWARGYGVREAGKPDPVETDTIFQAGSISKTATALAALRLVDMGILALDEDANTFLKSWQVPSNGPWQPRVTLRQLLSHTAGTTVNGFAGYHQEEEIPSLLQTLNGEKPANNRAIYVNLIPGTQFRYSGGGTTIVQQMLMDVTGKPFPDLMQELLLGPLGMVHSTFKQRLPGSHRSLTASGHYWVRKEPVAGKWHVYPEMAAAGLWTTPSDLARMAIGIQRAKAGIPGSLLSKEIVEEMLTPQLSGRAGLGLLNLESTHDSVRFGHGGSTHGYVAELAAYTTPQVGAAIMTNSFVGEPLIFEILRAIAQEYGWPDAPAPKRIARIEPQLLDRYTGKYEFTRGTYWKVTREGDTLLLHPAAQAAIDLHPRSNSEFFASIVDAEAAFTISQGGLASEMILRQNGQEKSMKRV